MNSVDKVAKKLGIPEEEAKLVIAKAETYWNKGKGLVFENHKTTDELIALFVEKPLWLSAELNERVGWQFSQSVYWLRRAGWKIDTVSLGGYQYAYKLVSKPEESTYEQTNT